MSNLLNLLQFFGKYIIGTLVIQNESNEVNVLMSLEVLDDRVQRDVCRLPQRVPIRSRANRRGPDCL